jgi:hypothetical protein
MSSGFEVGVGALFFCELSAAACMERWLQRRLLLLCRKAVAR